LKHETGQRPERGSEDEEDLNADSYLFSCDPTRAAVSWGRLTVVATRVLTRLLIDQEALDTHLLRLHSDHDRFAAMAATFETELRESILDNQPISAFDETVTFRILILLADPQFLIRNAAAIRQDNRSLWKTASAAPRPPFVPGDRDDRAAERLYQLARVLFAEGAAPGDNT
jgi:hypothetical protein